MLDLYELTNRVVHRLDNFIVLYCHIIDVVFDFSHFVSSELFDARIRPELQNYLHFMYPSMLLSCSSYACSVKSVVDARLS